MKLKLATIIIMNLVFLSTASAQECKFLEKEIKYGEKGGHVTKLQKFLVEQKLLKTNIFGNFGPTTRTAILNYQNKNKLKKSGYVDGTTFTSLNNLFCKNFIDNGNNKSKTEDSQYLANDSVQIVAGRVVNLKDAKLCRFGSGKIEWGSGNYDVIGERVSEFECKQGFYHLYSRDGEYEIKIYDSNNKIKYTTKVNVNGSRQENASIDEFYSKELNSENSTLIWKTTKSKECKISNGSITEKVSSSGFKNFNSKVGEVFTLTCVDDSGRESSAKAIIGSENVNRKFLIKQFNYIVQSGRIFLTWETSMNVKNCAMEGNPNIPLDGVVEFIASYGSIELQCFSISGDQESASISINNHILSNLPKILDFTYKISGENVNFKWSSQNANLCSLWGDLFSGGDGKVFLGGTGTISVYLPYNEVDVRLMCASGGMSDFKTITVKK